MDKDKLEAQKQWNTTPCGTGDFLAGIACGSREYFDAIRRNRYEVTDTWMKKTIDYNMARGKKLLEVGHGIGSDLLTFCEGGAEVYGIDITEEHHRLAALNFRVHNQTAVLKLCDSANIDFPSDHFDFVYSHGVLHHTPDTVRCISEAYRVLKPGGRMILSLYYTYSAFHLFSMILFEGLIHGKLKKLGYRRLMSTVENGADGVNIKPLVKTYRKKQLKYMLADFSHVEFKIAHFKKDHIPVFGKLLPKFLEQLLEPVLGWYIIAVAVK